MTSFLLNLAFGGVVAFALVFVIMMALVEYA